MNKFYQGILYPPEEFIMKLVRFYALYPPEEFIMKLVSLYAPYALEEFMKFVSFYALCHPRNSLSSWSVSMHSAHLRNLL